MKRLTYFLAYASSLTVAALACSCADEQAAAPFELGTAHASVMLAFGDSLTRSPPTHVSLQVAPQGELTTFENATATVDGLPLTTAGLGGGGTVPTFRTSELPPPTPSSTFRVTDGHVSMEMAVDNLFQERSVAVTSGSGATLNRGQVVTLAWSPSTDALLYAVAVFRPDDAASPSDSYAATDTRVEGSRITFTVPAGRPGRGVLAVTASATLPVRACAGVASCSASTSNLTVSFPTELTP